MGWYRFMQPLWQRRYGAQPALKADGARYALARQKAPAHARRSLTAVVRQTARAWIKGLWQDGWTV